MSTWAANPARYPALTSTQRDFLHASQNAVTRSARRRSAVAILAVLALVASIASVFAFQQRTSAPTGVTRPFTTRSSLKPCKPAPQTPRSRRSSTSPPIA